MQSRVVTFAGVARASLMLALASACAFGAEPSSADVRELLEQNRRLQEQVRTQQQTIDSLTAKMAAVLKASDRHEKELRGLREQVEAPASPASAAGRDHEVRISAEAGLAFFHTGRDGQFPKDEFRVDEATISVEAPVAKNVYLFTEMRLQTREANENYFELGEVYVDFEDVSAAWGQPGLLNIRAGRFNSPFGEEYQVRSVVKNPLISRSLSDIWGINEGAEIYGKVGPLRYALAVQNGGISSLHDFNADKSLAGRVSWDPAGWLHVSASAMRTGELTAATDSLSALWFAGGFFRSIGPAASTSTFWASLGEGDATAHWKDGHATAALGQVRYGDNDKRNDNSRRLRYGYLEIMQGITERLYGAVRYSEIQAPRGYPLSGWGKMGLFFFRPSLTESLKRLSVGMGYRVSPAVTWKTEYAAESGRMINGAPRDNEDFFGSEIAVKF